ncbi:hypothetical protein BJ138DRAFT_264571 [Hygrophoropsis aurantiaca]|uniref:Uncharacterized protein n=1 Tax=Hygrophoropsis aurantiaca TaxID=72124 RepID=A0ACB8A7D7_9AGAM|nr:hypothetical protein BJ138DRAFT_264571 [Hygrophoropsis aurantiaca]
MRNPKPNCTPPQRNTAQGPHLSLLPPPDMHGLTIQILCVSAHISLRFGLLHLTLLISVASPSAGTSSVSPCLQSWFRKAPSTNSDIDMFNNNASDPNIHDNDNASSAYENNGDDDATPRSVDISPSRTGEPATDRALGQLSGLIPNPRQSQRDRQREYRYRCKTCPCCRAAVRHRPIPVFVVRAIAGPCED